MTKPENYSEPYRLDAESLVRFANLDEVDTLITDAAPSDELADALADADVQLVLA